MKNNYRKALQRAQQGVKIELPKKQYVGSVNPHEGVHNVNPGFGRAGQQFSNPGGSVIGDIDMNNNGIPDYLENTSVIPMESQGEPAGGSYDINKGVFPSDPSRKVDTMQMAQIGKENYMSALKTFKKGGSK